MKKIYICQISFSFDKSLVYLPYAAGCLSAAVFSDDVLRKTYGLPEILFLRKTAEENFREIKDPDVVAFSTYFWNYNYNVKLAKMVKEKYPSCVIIFGGHQVAPGGGFLEKFPFIDFLLHGEGEISFPKLLKALDEKGDCKDIPGISYRKNGEIVNIPPVIPRDLSSFVSPYTIGVFDKMLAEHPDTEFHATIETNRGCPYGCSYCEWSFEKTLRAFPMEKIENEIKWVSEHKIPYCYCADGNFGIWERDIQIARTVIKYRELNGYPQIFKPCYAKGGADTVFEAGCILNEAGADKGITISYQSMDSETLKCINRHNLDTDEFTLLAERFNRVGIPTYSELILGLPGETLESFKRGLCRLPELGQHNSVTCHHCQVYPNSEMYDPAYREKYGIVTQKVPVDTIHYTADYNGTEEFFYIVTATSSMSFGEWQEANVFSVMVETFHYLGLLKCFAVFLRNEYDVSYYDFYSRAYEHIKSIPESFTGNIFTRVAEKASHPETGWAYQNDDFGSTGWYQEEGCFLELCRDIEKFKEDMAPFLSSFGVSEDIFAALFDYQFDIIRKPSEKDSVTFSNGYDFYSYFRKIFNGEKEALRKKDCTVTVTFHKHVDNWVDYAREIIWYGKRRGETLITNDTEDIKKEYI